MNHKLAIHEEHITFFRTCMHCREETAITVDVASYDAWRGGELIQDVWPELDADIRELYISGTHPSCWDEMFPPEDEL